MTEQRPNSPTEIQAEFVKIDSLISAASRLVGDGRLVDLSALERRTADVCDAAVALPAEQSRPLLPMMEQLISSLDSLTTRLTDLYGDLPNLQSEAAPRASASAYGHGQD